MTDWFARFLSGVGFAGIVWVLIGVWLFVREKKKGPRFFIPICITLGASWIIVEFLLKYAVSRPRPTEDMGAIIVGNGASWFSFPSSHATVAFAMATLLSRYEPRWKILLFILAGLISFSRIYLGVHYPFDVFAGAIIGLGIGLAIRSVPAIGSTRTKAKKPIKKG